MSLQDRRLLVFDGRRGDVLYTLRYQSIHGHLAVVAGLKNLGTNRFAPKQARLVLGVDTEMLGCPQWNEVLFPTLLRCEPTHFWGYFMGPAGRILGVASATDRQLQPGIQPNRPPHFHRQPRPLHAPPLPPRHPQHLAGLAPGEQMSWTIFLVNIDSLEPSKPALAGLTDAPMVEADRYTLAERRTRSPDALERRAGQARLVTRIRSLSDNFRRFPNPPGFHSGIEHPDVRAHQWSGRLYPHGRHSRRQAERSQSLCPPAMVLVSQGRPRRSAEQTAKGQHSP